MYPTILSDNIGVLIQDKNFKIGQQIRDALKQGKRLYLVRKKKFVVDR